MFDGLGEGINIVPMDAKFNGCGGEWYKMEARWKNTLENNGTVQVKIEPIYSGDSKRPTSFKIQEVVNGNFDEFILQNTETGK